MLDSKKNNEINIQLNLNNMPNHIAIIMDGNGRWAKRNFLPRFIGHTRGLNALERTVKSCIKFGIKELTVFAFSTENWKRPIKEIDFLMNLFFRHFLKFSSLFA